MSISTNIDMLIVNLLMFSWLGASFPVKMAERSKLLHVAAGCAQQAKRAWQVKAGQRPVFGTASKFAGQKTLFSGWHYSSHFVLFLKGTFLVAIWFDFLQNCNQSRKLPSAFYYKNKPDQNVNFAICRTTFLKEIKNGYQNENFWNQASKVSVYYKVDLLITNFLMFCHFGALFPVTVVNKSK